MKSTLLFLMFLVWALWFGGTISVFIFGGYFRSSLSNSVFHEAAHAMFQVFAKYELALTAGSLVIAGLLLVTYPSKLLLLMIGCLVLAGGMVVTVALGLMPQMESLRDQGKTASPEFIKLHVKSMIAMAMQAGMLVLTGMTIFFEARNCVTATRVLELPQKPSFDLVFPEPD